MNPNQADDKFSVLTESQKTLIESYVDGRLSNDSQQELEALLSERFEARAYLRALSVFESAVSEEAAALAASRESDQALGGWAWQQGGRSELGGEVLVEARGKNKREGGNEPAGASTLRDGGQEAGQGGSLLRSGLWPLGGSAKPVLKYALVAAWTLVAVLLVQSFLGEAIDERAATRAQLHKQLHVTKPDGGAEPIGFGVAQVADSQGVVWADGQRGLKTGDRLSKELIALEAGVLVIGFDTGPRLTLTGPARFQIDAPNGATLLAGLIRFEHDGLGDAFDLKTPKALLVDLGTSYAVRVEDGHEEIHVMDGEVWRSPVGYAGENNLVMLSAGDARRFVGSGNEPGAQIALDTNVFESQSDLQNELNLSDEPGKLLVAFTPSDVLTARVKPKIKRDVLDGVWRGPWRLTQRSLETKVSAELSFQQPKPEQGGVAKVAQRKKMPKLVAGEPWGGRVWARRVLAEPIRTDMDQVFYARMDLGVGQTNTKKPNAIFAVLTCQGSPGVRLSAALQAKRKGYLVARTQGVKRDAVELSSNTAMTMLIKIQTRANGPDQLFMSVFEADQVPEYEPDRWQLVGPPTWADEPLDLLGFQIISEIGLRFDGLRLGTGWRIATSVSDLTK